MPVPMVDLATGKTVDVPDEHVQTAFMSRQYGLPQGSTIPMARPDGSIWHIDATDAATQFQGGARVASAEQVRKAELEAKYGGIGGTAEAAVEGGLSGPTLGGSDVLAVKAAKALGGPAAGEAVREHMAGIAETHPKVRTAASLATTIAATALSGGAEGAIAGGGAVAGGAEALGAAEGVANAARVAEAAEGVAGATKAASAASEGMGLAKGAAQAVSAPLRATVKAGEIAERIVGSVLPEADSAVGRIAVNAVKKAASNATEMGLFGVGQEVSEATLGDKDLNAQSLLAAMGHGALVGAVMGAGMGAAGTALGEGASAVARKLAPKLEEASGEAMFKALGAEKKVAAEAALRGGGTAAVGRTVLRETGIGAEGIAKAGLTVEEIAPKIDEAVERVGKKLGDSLQQSKASVSLREIDHEIDAAVKPLRRLANREGAVQALENYRNSLFEKLGIPDAGTLSAGERVKLAGDAKVPVQALVEQRQALGVDAFGKTAHLETVPDKIKGLRDLYGRLSGVEERAIDRAAREMGGPTGAELKDLKKTYTQLTIAQKAASAAVEAGERKPAMGLAEKIGAGLGFMHAGPIGAAKAVLAEKALDYVKARGNSLAAVMLDRGAQLGFVQKAKATVEKEMDQAVDGFLYRKNAAPKAEGPKIRARAFRSEASEEKGDTKARYDARVKQVAAMSAGPAMQAEAVSKHLGGLGTHAPQTTMALTVAAQKATQFLSSKIPNGNIASNNLQPTANKQRISDSEMHTFMRYAKAVDDPMSVARDMNEGRITPEAAEALKAVYPKLYDQLGSRLMTAIAQHPDAIPYDKAVQLGILFERPTDETLRPDFVQMLQQAYAGHQEGPKTPGAPQAAATKRPLKESAKATTLGTQSLELGP